MFHGKQKHKQLGKTTLILKQHVSRLDDLHITCVYHFNIIHRLGP